MSKHNIEKYYQDLDSLIFLSKITEGNTRFAFENLLREESSENNLILVSEDTQKSVSFNNKNIRYDGIVFNKDKLSFGIWEAKDSKDKLHTD